MSTCYYPSILYFLTGYPDFNKRYPDFDYFFGSTASKSASASKLKHPEAETKNETPNTCVGEQKDDCLLRNI